MFNAQPNRYGYLRAMGRVRGLKEEKGRVRRLKEGKGRGSELVTSV